MPKAGKTFSSARGCYCNAGATEDGQFGQYLYVGAYEYRDRPGNPGTRRRFAGQGFSPSRLIAAKPVMRHA